MHENPLKTSRLSSFSYQGHSWLRHGTTFLVLVVLALGILFRLSSLDQHVFWHDETYTALRLSGYSVMEANADVFSGRVVSIADLMTYQLPNNERGLLDVVRSLAVDDAQHPPFYYVLARLWVDSLGMSPAILRLLSVLISLLSFPLMFCLCRELLAYSSTGMRSPVGARLATATGQYAIALLAVSPFQLLYAQEARQYSLLTVTTLLSSLLLLRAMRLRGFSNWALYSLSLAISLYTHPFAGLVALGHGAYLLVIEWFRPTYRLLGFSMSFSVALLAFVPWLKIALDTWSTTGATWTSQPIPLQTLLYMWLMHIWRALIITYGDFGLNSWVVSVLALPLLALVGYSFYFMCRNAPIRYWWFVLSVVGSTFVPLALADLILGGQRSTPDRYLIPCFWGLMMPIAYTLALQTNHLRWLTRYAWKAIAVSVITIGIASCLAFMQMNTAWSKVVNYNLPTMANVINSSQRPLVVSMSGNINVGTIFALCYRLKNSARFVLMDGIDTPVSAPPSIPDGFSDVFLLNVSDPLRQQIEAQTQKTAESVFSDTHLFLSRLR